MTSFETWQVAIGSAGVLAVLFAAIMAVWVGQKQIEINNRLVELQEIDKEPLLYLNVENFRGFAGRESFGGHVDIKAQNYSSVPIQIKHFRIYNAVNGLGDEQVQEVTLPPGKSIGIDSVVVGPSMYDGTNRAVNFTFKVLYSRYGSERDKCAQVTYVFPPDTDPVLLTTTTECNWEKEVALDTTESESENN